MLQQYYEQPTAITEIHGKETQIQVMMCMFALHTLASVEHVENVNRKKRISRQIYQNRVAPNHFSFKFCAQSQSSSELIWIYL